MIGELAVILGSGGTMMGELAVILGSGGTMIGELAAHTVEIAKNEPSTTLQDFNEIEIIYVHLSCGSRTYWKTNPYWGDSYNKSTEKFGIIFKETFSRPETRENNQT